MTFEEDDQDVLAEAARLRVLFAIRLQQAMNKQKMTNKELAKRVGCMESRASFVVNGWANVTLATMARFGLALGIRWDLKKIR